MVRPHLPGTTAQLSGAAAGGGSYDPLISRLDPEWLPSGANLHEQAVENSVQSLRIEHWAGNQRRAVPTWMVNLSLYPPGVGTRPTDRWSTSISVGARGSTRCRACRPNCCPTNPVLP